MNVVVVDDEPLARQRLTRMVEAFPGYTVVAEAGDGATAIETIREYQPDIALLDIHMPGMDGLQVARQLAGITVAPATIFVTAHAEHALSAHNASVSGYLLKPIRRDALASALERARRPSRAQLSALGDTMTGQKPAYISARTRDRRERVPATDIIYFWADQKYTTVYHMHGELLIEASLSGLHKRLGDDFMRIHRKALVATRHIIGLHNDRRLGAHVSLRHGEHQLPVSRRRLAQVRALLDSRV